MSTGSDLVSSANLAALADQVAFLADQPALILLLVVIAGLLLGRVRLGGISLGSSGVIFVALAAGHLGFKLPAGIGTVGLVLFIYCIGLGAGPSFFRAFRRQGKSMALLATVLVVVGTVAAWIASRGFDLPTDLAAGVLAGALTSTPGLAAALESLPAGHHVGVGYGIAYPVGLIAVVLFVHLYPKLSGVNEEALRKGDGAVEGADREIVRVLVRVENPAVFGRKLADINFITDYNCQVSRLVRGNQLVPVPAGLVLEDGQRLLLIARRFRMAPIVQLLGKADTESGLSLNTEDQSLHVVVSSARIVGKSLFELNLRSRFGVTVTRVLRHDLEFVPRLADRIEYGDMLNVVGEHVDLERFAEFAGHRVRSFDETDLISLCVGVAAGVALGNVEIGVGGQMIRLGLAGGPLIVALVLGHLGHVGPIKGHVPRAARLLLTEIGLVLFLASAGLRAGAGLEEVLRSYGVALITSGLAVALAPLIAGALVARYVLHLSVFEILGGVCGGMTSTPGIGAVTGKTDADTPVVSYAAAYPVALILMTLVVRLLVELH
jgi:putative transport protein